MKGKRYPKVDLACGVCHKPFTVPYGQRDRLYCSRPCQARAIKRVKVAQRRSLCDECGIEFVHYGHRRFCGLGCASRAMSKERIAEANPNWKDGGAKESRVCGVCGDEFEYGRVGLHVGQSRKYCSLACRNVSRQGIRPDGNPALGQREYPHDFTLTFKKRIRERDGWQCVMCGKQGKSLSIHHIDYDKDNCSPENLTTLCKRCHGLTNFSCAFWTTFFTVSLSGAQIVKKNWGCEVITVNAPEYCLKYLVFFKGAAFSDHRHEIKKEMWHCLCGRAEVALRREGEQQEVIKLTKGGQIELPPGVIHQVHAVENTILVEVSTQHFDGDSYRYLENAF